MARIPEEVINEIKYRNDIESVISPYVTLKRRGKNLVGLCPFHNEKTPSFTVYPENGSFYCFGCGVGGDIFSFIGLAENLDYFESIKSLAEKSGVTLPQDGYDDSMQRLKNTVYEINRETAKFFHEYLMSQNGKWALDYLVGRGLKINTIKHFGLGAAPDSWDALLNHLKSKGYSIEDMITANVIGKSQRGTYYDRFRHRVMFPIINIRGRVIGFSGRAMPGEDKSGGKYVNTSDTPVYKKSENLFAMNFAKNFCDERIILVEGNMDVISLHQAGFENTVAALGTSFTSEQAKLLSRYTKEIVLTLDADAAGQKAVKRAGEILKDTGLNVRVVVLPGAKDPDEYIKSKGADKFRALIEGAVSEIEYKLLTAVDGIDTNTDDGKLKYLQKAAAIIAETPDAMARDIYIGRLSEKYKITRTTLESRVKELRKNIVKNSKKREFDSIIRPRYDKQSVNPEKGKYHAAAVAEENIISVLMQHEDLISHAQKKLSPDDMFTSLNKRIYRRILECEQEGRSVDISSFGEMLSPAEMGYLAGLSNSESVGKSPLVLFNECVSVLNTERLRLSSANTSDMTVDDWAQSMKNLIDNKK